MTDEELRERLDGIQARCDKLAEWDAVVVLFLIILATIWIVPYLYR